MANFYKPENDQDNTDCAHFLKSGKSRETFKNIVQGIFGFIFIVLYILGTYHSCTKHKDDSDILRYTPLVLYRGIEFFWHDDFAGVDWEERLRDDSVIYINIFNKSYDKETDQLEFNKKLELISQQLKIYPADKRDSLKSLSIIYIKYSNSFLKDIRKSYTEAIKDSEFRLSYSYRTQELEDLICKMLHPEDSKNFRKILEVVLGTLNKTVRNNINEGSAYSEQINSLTSYFKLIEINMNSNFSKIYRKLFKESLDDKIFDEFK